VLSALLYCPSPIQNSRERNNRCYTADCKPRDDVQRKSKISFRFRGEDTSWRITWVVNHNRTGVAIPYYRIRRVRITSLKWCNIPVFWIRQSIAEGNIVICIVDIVQKHINSRQVVGGQVDFLAKVAITDSTLTEHLLEFQEQRSRPNRWIIDFVNGFFSDHCDSCQEFRDFLRRIIFASRLAG